MNGKSGGYKLLTVYITNPRKMGGVEVEREGYNEWKERRIQTAVYITNPRKMG